MPNQEAAVIAEVLKQQWLFRFGTGTSLQSHTDKGMNFTSAAFKELSLILGIEKIQTTQFRRQWSTKNWRFEEWFNNTLKNNTIRCKKLATSCFKKLEFLASYGVIIQSVIKPLYKEVLSKRIYKGAKKIETFEIFLFR